MENEQENAEKLYGGGVFCTQTIDSRYVQIWFSES